MSNITDTKKLEKVFLEEIFNNNKVYDYEELKNVAKRVLGEDYSDGKVSGLVNKLIKNNVIVRIERGQYTRSDAYKIDIKSIVKSSLESSLEEIKEALGQMDIANISDKEFEDISEVRKLIRSLEEYLR